MRTALGALCVIIGLGSTQTMAEETGQLGWVHPLPSHAMVVPNGHFGAPTADKIGKPKECLEGHCGTDYAVGPDQPVFAPCAGLAWSVRPDRVELECDDALTIVRFDKFDPEDGIKCDPKRDGAKCAKSIHRRVEAGETIGLTSVGGDIHISVQRRENAEAELLYVDPVVVFAQFAVRDVETIDDEPTDEGGSDEMAADDDATEEKFPTEEPKTEAPPVPGQMMYVLEGIVYTDGPNGNLIEVSPPSKRTAPSRHSRASRTNNAPTNPEEPSAYMADGTSGDVACPLPFLATPGPSQKFGKHVRRAGGDWHHGEDHSAPTGTPIMATGNGRIFAVRNIGEQRGGNHFYVLLDQPVRIMGRWLRARVGYFHLPRLSPALEGRRVRRGERIASVGNSGVRNSGTHLHFQLEVLTGSGHLGGWEWADPAPYLAQAKAVQTAPRVASATGEPAPTYHRARRGPKTMTFTIPETIGLAAK